MTSEETGHDNLAYETKEDITDGNKPDNHINKNKENSTDTNGDIIKTDSSSVQLGDDVEEKARAGWGNGLEFLMSCIAMSVGLGNIWRFPFVAYENGGGAFLIPYIIVLLVVGKPLYYLEMCLGQFTSRGNVKMFETLAPAFKGIGYGQLLGVICVATYYSSIIALTLFYLVNSFTSNLPWSNCRDEWEEQNRLENIECVPSLSSQAPPSNSVSSSELYFRREVLNAKNQIDDGLGYPEWRLTLCLLGSWFVVFLVTRRGVQSSGKAAYFLAIFPYVIILTLLVRAATLEGAGDGMFYFINPDWSKLTDAKVWYSAVTQCFMSLNVGFGTIIMYSSYNDFSHNIYRDAMIVTTLDTFTSVLSGLTIFGILGHLAFKLDVDVGSVINSGGTGLAFISYPEAIAKFEVVPWLFAILFFFMLFVLGVGSLVALQAATFTVIKDSIPQWKILYVSMGTAIVGFLFALTYITPGGQYIFTLVDHFGGTMIILILAIFETTMIFWWYGLENFCDDVEYMMKIKVGSYWRWCWGLITPAILIFIFVYFIYDMQRLTHEGRDFPDSAIICGWLIVALGLAQIVLWWSYYLYHKRNLGFIESVKKSVSHSTWGPANAARLVEWRAMKKAKSIARSQRNLPWFKAKLYILLGKN